MNLPEPSPDISSLLASVRARTPARILTGRAGAGYRTSTQLQLRQDHAAARDAVHAEIDLARDLGPALVEQFALFEVRTRAATKSQYLMRPDLGRQLDDESRDALAARCPRGVELQLVIGDGLSAAAVAVQVPRLLPLLCEGAIRNGWRPGQTFFVRHCRVGILNDVGALLDPALVVLLIGERPGLATAESLSAYLAHRPRPGHTDAQRNLISNIHARGVGPEEATARILALAAKMMTMQTSGVAVKEDQTCLTGEPGASAPGGIITGG
jgi:ethanolamine ammonia-lyase small subunit